MSALVSMFVGFSIVIGGIFLYVLRLERLGRELEARVDALRSEG